jgi:hypothetical protein
MFIKCQFFFSRQVRYTDSADASIFYEPKTQFCLVMLINARRVTICVTQNNLALKYNHHAQSGKTQVSFLQRRDHFFFVTLINTTVL